MSDSLPAIGTAIVLALVVYVIYRPSVTHNHAGYLPPGPKGLPLIGNIFDMPMSYHYMTYSQWGKKYGSDIVSANVLGQPLIIVNSLQAVREMMEKKHALYANRPRQIITNELVGHGKDTLMLPYGKEWKDHRKMFARVLGSRTLAMQYEGVTVREARRLMRNILESPERVGEHILHASGNVLLKIAYGYEAKEENDSFVNLAEEVRQHIGVLLGPTAWIEALPFMPYLPTWFLENVVQKNTDLYRRTYRKALTTPFDMVKKQVTDGFAQTSFLSSILQSNDYDASQDDVVMHCAGSLYGAGTDTTVAQTYTFVLILMFYPEVQREAQEEIDAVVGSDRLPTHDYRERLPYCEAVIKETMRWHPSAPLGGRLACDNDMQDGYLIPKGSIVQPNIWHILHDPEIYDRPMEFDPERFIVDPPPLHPREVCFGFGRRICPGIHLAEASIWLTCVMMLSLFDIKPTSGSPAELSEYLFTDELTSRPKPFKCNLVLRSAKAEALIESFDDSDER